MTARPRIRRTGLALLLALSAACGSTASPGSDATGAGTDTGLTTTGGLQPGQPPGGSTGVLPPGGTTGTGGSTGGGTTSGTTGSMGGTGGTGATTGSVTNTGRSGPGVTATKIFVGDVQAVNTSAVDVPGVTRGDPEANVRALLDDINSKGGIAGRTVEIVFAQFDSSSAETADQQWARICEKFTRDTKVFAVLGVGTESYRQCVHKAGLVVLGDELPYAGASHYAKFPALIEQGSPNLDRVARIQVPALLAQNYFSPWNSTLGQPAASGRAKVGVLTYDDQHYARAVDTHLIPALKRAGYDPGANVARIGQVEKASDYSDQAAAVKSAQLRFASAGVTHVISFEGNGGLSLFFMNNAESQAYRPRYGINTTSGLQVLVSGGLVRREQARGATGFGWIPSFDLTADRNPDNGPYSSESRRQCLAVYKKYGISYSDPNAQAIALGYCNKLYLLLKTLNTTPALINQSTFVNAVDRVGSTFTAAGGLGSFLGPGRHDSAAKYYYWRWFDNCGCLHYDGPRRDLPW